VEDLINAIRARLVYFPAYACTSFAVSQLFIQIGPHRQHQSLKFSSTDRPSDERRRALVAFRTKTTPTRLRRRLYIVQVVQTFELRYASSVLPNCACHQYVSLLQTVQPCAEDYSQFLVQT
jgi:hypothetical protein